MKKSLPLASHVMSGIRSTHKEQIRSLFAFVQARTGSTRFPKKVITELPPGSGKTILDRLHTRILKILSPSRIVYLIPEGDTELADFLSERGMLFFSGPLEDVRQRYINAAAYFQADAILRLTGDNPFYDTTHLDLLIQAFMKEECDLAYFKGLPLGTGGEIFRTSALVSTPVTGLDERHREHVSIHIKEDPDRFRIIAIPSLLSTSDSERIPNFRLTIDTPEDFKTLSSLFTVTEGKNISEFGTYEFLELEKKNPNLFRGNKDVPQVRFPLPDPEKPDKGKVGVLVAPSREYGSGHFARTSILFSFLPFHGWEPVWLRDFPKDGEYNILLIDYRDVRIPIEYKKTKLLLLDHFGPERKKYPYWDLLPHPENEKEFDWEQILIPPALGQNPDGDADSPKQYDLFCYAGNLEKDVTFALDSFLETLANKSTILRVGGTEPEPGSKIKYFHRLSRLEYLSALRTSRNFLGYFGQSLFEALFLKVPSATFSISPVHKTLSQLLIPYGIPYTDLKSIPEFSVGTRTPSNNGYDLLLKKIESL